MKLSSCPRQPGHSPTCECARRAPRLLHIYRCRNPPKMHKEMTETDFSGCDTAAAHLLWLGQFWIRRPSSPATGRRAPETEAHRVRCVLMRDGADYLLLEARTLDCMARSFSGTVGKSRCAAADQRLGTDACGAATAATKPNNKPGGWNRRRIRSLLSNSGAGRRGTPDLSCRWT